MIYFIPVAIFGLVAAVWTGAFLFHLIPLAGPGFHWWELPWTYTVLLICAAVMAPFVFAGKWLAERYEERN